jgi:molybdopterin synthase catalytic subunit
LKKFPRITESALDVDALLEAAAGPGMGGTVAFIGTVRDSSEAGKVEEIDYDAYIPMAEKRMLHVEEEVRSQFPSGKIVMQHRVGKVKVGETTLVIAASSPHRSDAFAACRLGLEMLKQEVPIWKKERLAGGGDRWVNGPLPSRATTTRKRSR